MTGWNAAKSYANCVSSCNCNRYLLAFCDDIKRKYAIQTYENFKQRSERKAFCVIWNKCEKRPADIKHFRIYYWRDEKWHKSKKFVTCIRIWFYLAVNVLTKILILIKMLPKCKQKKQKALTKNVVRNIHSAKYFKHKKKIIFLLVGFLIFLSKLSYQA